jgi:hypothetical protein
MGMRQRRHNRAQQTGGSVPRPPPQFGGALYTGGSASEDGTSTLRLQGLQLLRKIHRLFHKPRISPKASISGLPPPLARKINLLAR